MDVTSQRISLTAWGRLYGFNKATTSRLHREGKLPPGLVVEKFPTGRYFVVVPEAAGPECVLYARVSSSDQKEDLERQVGRLTEYALEAGLRPTRAITEIGSGLNGRRRKLLEALSDKAVGTILVEHRDRLCRFGFEYLEAALGARGARIVVAEQGELDDDLVRDVMEVLTSFCARLYGRRSAKRRAAKALAATKERLP